MEPEGSVKNAKAEAEDRRFVRVFLTDMQRTRQSFADAVEELNEHHVQILVRVLAEFGEGQS